MPVPIRWVAVLLAAVAVVASAGPPPARPHSYAQRADVAAFVDEMVAQHGFDRSELRRLLGQAKFQPQIVAAMDRPVVAPPKWYEYAPQFLAAARVDDGVAFWDANAEALARAEAQYGVPAAIVVAIVGVETFYGRHVGRHRVLDALATLAFDYPRRAAFFRGELAQFLLLSRELGLPPLALNGSFAGAMGLPQFMPGSYRNFAVDFDADGRIDLWKSASDAIGSVAHYLARHDWQRGQPVLLPAKLDPAREAMLLRRLDGGLSERRALDAWAGDGVEAGDVPADLVAEPVGLLLLEERAGDRDVNRYQIACHNFYVITRYNRSRLYASAVRELAAAIATARGGR